MKSCDVCLGNGKRLQKICPNCNGLGFVGKISKEDLVSFISHESKKADFNIILQDSEKTSVNGIECSAFMDAKTRVLAVAIKNANFFENLVHEFCHLRQFDINCPVWVDGSVNGVDSADILDGFLNGSIVLNEFELRDIVNRIIELEWDCETRVKAYLRQIIDYPKESLNIYNVNAFIYMRFYRAVEHFGRWYLPGQDFLKMNIHSDYMGAVVGKISRWPEYNDELTPEEIELFRKCFE